VRAHVFVCMLAYYLEWHMRRRLAPMLYDDTDKQAAEAQRSSVVAKAERSPAAVTKQTTGRTDDGLHSFRTLLADLATLTRNTLVTAAEPAAGTQGNFVGLEVDRTVASIAGAASIGSSRGAATIRPAPPKSVALVWGVLCG